MTALSVSEMKVLFLSVGKKNDPALALAITDFTDRIGHYTSVEWKIVPSGETIEEEGKTLLNIFTERDFVVLLDERGKEMDSAGLAAFIDKRLSAGTYRLVIVIGGAYGASNALRKRAEAVLSLSQLTFPHQLTRLIVAEQVYRAFTILKGEKYHHS